MYRLFAFAATLALAVSLAVAEEKKDKDKKDDKVPSIETIMMEAHGEEGLRAKVKEAIKEKNWDDARKATDEWVKLAAVLGKNDPPKGTKDSWKKQTDSYEKQIK